VGFALWIDAENGVAWARRQGPRWTCSALAISGGADGVPRRCRIRSRDSTGR